MFFIKNMGFCLLLVLVFALPGEALSKNNERQSGKVESQFAAALVSAYNKSPDLEQKFFQQQQTVEGISRARAGWRPSVRVAATAERDKKQVDSPSSSKGIVGYTTTMGDITATQNLFKGWGTVASVSSAENSAKAGESDFTKTEQDTLIGAAGAYFDLYAAQQVYELNEKNVDIFQKLLDSVVTRAKVGELTGTDIANAQSQLADAMNQRIQARTDLESKTAKYIRAVGENPPQKLVLPQLPLESIPSDYKGLLSQALVNNPAIITADYNVRSGSDSVVVSRSVLFPSVDVESSAQRSVVGNVARNIGGGSNSRGESFRVKATLNVPLYQGGAEWSDLRKAQSAAVAAKVALEAVRQNLRRDSYIQWQSWVSAKLQIDQLSIKIKSAQVALDGIRNEFKEGERIFIEVQQAEKDLFGTRVALEQAKHDLYVATYSLLSILGKMTASFLQLPVVKYDVEGYTLASSGKLAGTLCPRERT